MRARFAAAVSGNVLVVMTVIGVGLVAAGVATRHATSAALPATLPARTHVVEIRGFVFEPAVLQVSLGDTVVWINRDVAPHTATAADRSWDTGNLATGQSARRVVTAGDSAYFCAYHTGMKGRLSVRRASDHAAPKTLSTTAQ